MIFYQGYIYSNYNTHLFANNLNMFSSTLLRYKYGVNITKNNYEDFILSDLLSNKSILEIFELLALRNKDENEWILDFSTLKHFNRDYYVFD